jgi:hypothetical protein
MRFGVFELLYQSPSFIFTTPRSIPTARCGSDPVRLTHLTDIIYAQLFSSREVARDPRNHCVPLVDIVE